MKVFGILCFLHSCLSIIIICQAEDTITKTQFLADGETIVSSNGTFELGFFSPGNSKKRYVGMWYKEMSTTAVWVANRETPLADTAGVLKVIDPGILVLVNGSSSIIWSTNASISAQNPVAQLLESGNLVVKAVNGGNSEKILWQSFDHPGDTFLAGMKLGKNWVTGKEWYLSSWRSTDDPAPGDYTYSLDIHGYPQIFLYKGSTKLFCSGPWNGVRFSGPHLRQNSIYKYGVAFEKDEIYYRYDLLDSSVVSRFILTPNGIGQRWTWVNKTNGWVLYLTVPTDNCDNYGLCGPYGTCNVDKSPVCGCLSKFVPKYPIDWNLTDWSGGCVRRTELDCSKGDGFVKYNGLKMPDAANSWVDKSMTLEQCREVCLKNCSCMAYSNLDIRNGGSGCLIWFGDLVNFRDFSDNGFDIYIRMSSSDLDSTVHQVAHHRKTKVVIAVSLALFSGSLLLGLAIIYYILKKKKRNPSQDTEGHSVHSSEQRCDSKSHNEDLELPLFDLATIARSTDNFSENNKLGEGGFGPVYKGMLEGGQEIAVKRLSEHSRQGPDEFKNEVICIAKLQHRNLVKLLGCCIRGEEKMLIYEYMPNKSLDYFIFGRNRQIVLDSSIQSPDIDQINKTWPDETRRTLLDWPKRFHIINGIARGLLYLHQDSRLRIIHRDLKASNILLDIDMNPKISDFGMARSFGGNETQANTKRVVGTYGYMSPEYAVDGLFSVKSDVFSFGVLVLEIVSGKRNRGFYHPDHDHNLLGHAWKLYKGGRSLEVMDESLGESCHLSEVLRSIHVGLLCVQQGLEDRPSMASVVLMLGGEGALPEPKQPGFYTERSSKVEAGASSSTVATNSANQLTITLLDGR